MNAPRFRERAAIFALFCVLSASVATAVGSAEVIGPAPYLQLSDSPFDGMTFDYFHVDDMEDGVLNTPGVTASGGAPYGPSGITDSVDEDDGAVDGFGTGGYSFFSGNGLGGIQFTFDESVLGAYPTHVGIVWTDGTDDIEFTAYDRYDMVIGNVTGAHADDNFLGGTGEDRFYGIIAMGGVKSIVIKNSVPSGGAGIEVDHLQYGGMVEAPPADTCKYSLTFNGTVTPVHPVTGETSAVDFYSYDNPATSSANTGLEEGNAARFWIYEDPVGAELSLFVVLDTPDDEDGGGFSLAVSGAPSGASILVEDDDSDALSWDSAAGTGTATWNWDPCCTDGWVVGYLTGSWDIVLTPSNAVGIDGFEFVSGSATGEPEIIQIPMDGSFTISRVCEEEPPPVTTSCPRGPGFWKQQCAQKGNGSTKYSREEVEKIAACADENSEYFDWGEGDAFAGFCYALDPPKPMSQEKQLKRKFATMLANVCAGELGLIANNGSTVSLDRNTPLDCDGVDADTVDELIGEIDDALEAGSGYGPLLECMEYVDEYLEDDCDEHDDGDDGDDGDDEVEHHMGIGTPSPNPFQLHTTFSYSVPGESWQMVSIQIYNVAGRLIRTLVSESKAPGDYEIGWDGRDSGGRQASRGVYFVRGALDGQPFGAPARVLYLR